MSTLFAVLGAPKFNKSILQISGEFMKLTEIASNLRPLEGDKKRTPVMVVS